MVLKRIIGYFMHIRFIINSNFQLLRVFEKGKNNAVYGKITIINPHNVKIGSSCSFNHGVYINALNPIVLCDDVTLSAGVKIVSTGIDYIKWAQGKREHVIDDGIKIGDHVWIGANAMILDGVSITGKYVVVAAGAVVTRSINEDYCIVAGVPAKVISKYSITELAK